MTAGDRDVRLHLGLARCRSAFRRRCGARRRSIGGSTSCGCSEREFRVALAPRDPTPSGNSLPSLPRRRRPFVQDLEIAVVPEKPVAPLARQFANDRGRFEGFHGGGDGWNGQARPVSEALDRLNRVPSATVRSVRFLDSVAFEPDWSSG